MSRIDLDHIWKIYPRGDVVAVQDVSFVCKEREFLAILGPSGGGKSSTLRMLAGLEDISKGTISFDGKVVNELGPAERNVALAFESYALYQRLSVYENIAFPLKARGMKKSEVEKKVRYMAELMDLVPVLDTYPAELAGGHQQRVSLARAFIRKPNVTLLDEPISHMDQRVRAELRARIRRLHDDLGLTTIYVTHDQAEAISLCDRLVILNEAKLQQIGTVEEIWNSPANRFVAYFVGEPAMNFVDGMVENDERAIVATSAGKAVLPFTGTLEKQYISSKITIGFRPQQVTISRKKVDQGALVGSIKIIEFQGDTSILTIKLANEGGTEVKAVVEATQQYQPDESVWIQIKPDTIHLFDGDYPALQRNGSPKG